MVNQFTQEQYTNIISKLNKKKAILPCPRCGNHQFTLLDGYLNPIIQNDLQGVKIGGRTIPCAVTICTNCGYLSYHALGALGMLPDKKDSNKEGDRK